MFRETIGFSFLARPLCFGGEYICCPIHNTVIESGHFGLVALIGEAVYCLHRRINACDDDSVFCSTSFDDQLQIIKMVKIFSNCGISMENHEKHNISTSLPMLFYTAEEAYDFIGLFVDNNINIIDCENVLLKKIPKPTKFQPIFWS